MIYGDEDEDKLETDPGRQAAVMSVHDKMAMWGARSREEPREPDSSDCFVGVPEDDSNQHITATHPELSLYTQTIVESPAYQWLVDRLFRESFFHWDDTQPQMLHQISQSLAAELPTGVISRKQEPNHHKVTFYFPWGRLRDRLMHEQSVRNIDLGTALSDSIVLTSSSGYDVQATTVEQYLVQTWGPGGTQILTVLQGLMDDGTQPPSRPSKYLSIYLDS